MNDYSYEGAYERLIEKKVPFYALDISGLNWVKIDNDEDFTLGVEIFNMSEIYH